MKKFFLLAVIASFSLLSKAQDDTKVNVIKVNPLGLLFGSASIGYERALNEKGSIVISPLFGGFKLGGIKYTDFGGGLQYRFYLSNSHSAPAGLWAGPQLNFIGGKVKADFDGDGVEDKNSFTAFGGNVMIGNQWIFNSGFVIDLGGGVSYQKFTYKDNTNSNFVSLKASGVLPALGFSLGYNF